jgi:hypothetical protein
VVWRCWGLLGAGGGRRIHGRFTPTPGSGLNLVEVWFGIIERQAIPGEPSPEPVKSSAVVYERFFVSCGELDGFLLFGGAGDVTTVYWAILLAGATVNP